MPKTILIVDDEPDIAKVLAVRLINYHFDVEIAHSAKEALERIQKKIPDLMIVDIMMPEMSGTDLVDHLKQDKTTKNIPCIFLSAILSKKDEFNLAQIIGQEAILAKPYDIDVLIKKIHLKLPEE